MRKFKSENGQAIVELAFVLPFILILLLGLIEFGVLFYNQAMLTNASREGARAGMTYTSDGSGNYWDVASMRAAVSAAVNRYLQGRLINFGGTPSWTTSSSRTGGSPGDPDHPEYNTTGGTVSVAVTYTHTFLVYGNFIGSGNTVNIGSQTIMRLE
jgi:Flp pilus assembly protein TadG